jgi:uncharacterized protein
MPDHVSERPVSGRERLLALDVLRGFAMVGVLIAYCMWSLGTAPEESWSPLDHRIGDAVGFLIDGKFYTILATLFGLGFSIQLGRASDDAAAVETYCRRLAILAGIGLAHALLLRNGDILLPYALTGFLLIPFRRASDRMLILSALAILIANAALRAFWTDLGFASLQRPDLRNASYLTENVAWVRYWYSTALFTWPTNLTMFLLGYCAGRAKLWQRLSNRSGALVVLLTTGLAAGTALHAARVALLHAADPSPLVGSIAWLLFTFHCWGMSSAYAAGLLLLLKSTRGGAALSPLAAVGKMALTNYLLQAGIAVPLCLAFGWFDHFTPTSSLLLVAGILAFELPFSLLWTRNFQFGPAEWVWRVLTYQHLPPMRRPHGELAPL